MYHCHDLWWLWWFGYLHVDLGLISVLVVPPAGLLQVAAVKALPLAARNLVGWGGTRVDWEENGNIVGHGVGILL